MSASDVPYRLRPNKFIDRQLFLDLLSRLVPSVGHDRYAYLSMGGRHLVDHSAVYRRVGISKLYSFDCNGEIVRRQQVNRPIDQTVCEELTAGRLPGRIDEVEAVFPDTTNLVVWLDYTSPNERLTQLQELIEVAKRLQPNDILRITLNANLGNLDGPKGEALWKRAGFPSPKEYRLAKLKEQLGSFVPEELVGIGEDEFPACLCKCVSLALSLAEQELTTTRFRPILLTSYRDGQRMVTATCLAYEGTVEKPDPIPIAAWPSYLQVGITSQ